jgi:predicted  nucleic acid-binding Zn-ribbon protein
MILVKNIIELQNIDLQLMELEDIIGDLPRKIEESLEQEKQLLNEIDENKNRIKDIQLLLNKMELQVKQDNEKIDNLKDQLFQVTTNRQYDAIMSEIDHLKVQVDEIENKEIELIEEKENLEKKISEQDASIKFVSKDLHEKRENLEKLMQESAEQKEDLEKTREALIKTIDPDIIKRYDMVRKARRGTAVVPVTGNSCSGCGAVVPPQKVAEIKEEKSAHTCDECSRFLYIEN